jgi:MFS family permease
VGMKQCIKAVVLSNIFDIGISSLFGAIASVFIMSHYGIGIEALRTNPDAYTELLNTHTLLHTMLLIPGGIISIFAGYLAAKIAKRRWLLMGALSSTLCTLGGLIVFVASPTIGNGILLVIGPFLGMSGACVYSSRS